MFQRTTKVSNHLANYSFLKWFESRSKMLAVIKVVIEGMAQMNEMNLPIILKGYLRYKMLTSQNLSSEAQIKNFFIS